MAAFSVASGVALLYDEGVLPYNPAKQALSAASPADEVRLNGDGFAMRRTAVALAMDDNLGQGSTELSAAAMQFVVQELATPAAAAPRAQSSEAASQQSGYPYGGWASSPAAAAPETAATLGTPTARIDVLA